MLTVTHIDPNGNETVYPAIKVVRDYKGLPDRSPNISGHEPGVLIYRDDHVCTHIADGEVYVKADGKITNHYALTHLERKPLAAA